MEKFNWKEEFKKSLAGMGKEMLGLLYMFIALGLVFLTQTEAQLKAVFALINEGDWVVMFLILIGIMALSVVVEKVVKVIFWLVTTPFKPLFRSVKYKTKNENND